MPTPLIDWVVAEWVAGRMAGTGATAINEINLVPLAADAQQRVVAYTGLVPAGPIPIPEGVSRREWVASNIASTRAMLDPVLEGVAGKLSPAKNASRLWLGVATSAQLGLMVGYLAQRVMGQYELSLLDATPAYQPAPGDAREPRLLFVLPNLDDAVQKLDADRVEFVTWVMLHEVTHAVQFGGVPWLRDYLASLLRELLDGAEKRMETRRILHLPSRAELARVGRAARHGDLIGMIASEPERVAFDRAQAVMAVIEGHAEHVMDAVAPELLPSLPKLRAALDRRRKSQRGLSKYVAKLLGLEMKMRQYEQGKTFCDALVKADGREALTRLFSSPEALPTLAELERPELWLARKW
jgi:coenzyme F420 biosynthesis associated uncharacterized protein